MSMGVLSTTTQSTITLDDPKSLGSLSVGIMRRTTPEKEHEETSFLDQCIERNLLKKIARHLEEIRLIRDVLGEIPGVPSSITDHQILLFLAAADYDLNTTCLLMKRNYDIRIASSEFFSSRSIFDSNIQRVWSVVRMTPLAKQESRSKHLLFCGLKDFVPERFDGRATVKLFLMCADMYHLLEGIPHHLTVVIDVKGLSYDYYTPANDLLAKFMIKYVQESMPFTVHSVHVINATPIIYRAYKFIKPFLTKAIISMVHFHEGNDMTTFLPKAVVPKEFGGSGPASVEDYQSE